MYMPTRDEIRAAHRQGADATIQLFEHLARKLQTLQDQMNKNSKNSSKPLHIPIPLFTSSYFIAP